MKRAIYDIWEETDLHFYELGVPWSMQGFNAILHFGTQAAAERYRDMVKVYRERDAGVK